MRYPMSGEEFAMKMTGDWQKMSVRQQEQFRRFYATVPRLNNGDIQPFDEDALPLASLQQRGLWHQVV